MAYLQFVLSGKSPSGKTNKWSVQSTTSDDYFGLIMWYAQWRKYTFYPYTGAILAFDASCLREIADFCESKTREHKDVQ
jgi:hypothetical protein